MHYVHVLANSCDNFRWIGNTKNQHWQALTSSFFIKTFSINIQIHESITTWILERGPNA